MRAKPVSVKRFFFPNLIFCRLKKHKKLSIPISLANQSNCNLVSLSYVATNSETEPPNTKDTFFNKSSPTHTHIHKHNPFRCWLRNNSNSFSTVQNTLLLRHGFKNNIIRRHRHRAMPRKKKLRMTQTAST